MPANKPEEVDQIFAQAMKGGDTAAVLALYENGATLVPDPSQPPVSGAEALRSALTGFASLLPEFDMHPKVIMENDDLAVVYNDWTGRGRDPQGNEVPMQGNSVEVLRRQADGSWKFIFDDPFARTQG